MKQILLATAAVAMWLGTQAQTTVTYNYTGATQTFTVPACVTSVTINAKGAQGGQVTVQSPLPQGGLGATMQGDFAVNPGDVLTIIVGQRGMPDPSSSGGGGGSGVNNGSTILIVAGGGAGVDFQDPYYPGQHAVVTNDGVNGNGVNSGLGGTAGNAGGDHAYTPNDISRGGNGWLAGLNGSTGASGASINTTFTAGTWGIGGGGGGVGNGWCNCGGGGGGYSGGGSAAINLSGGGGGSYNIGTNQVNTSGNNTGDGVVTITYSITGAAPAAPAGISGSTNACANGDTVMFSIATVPTATGYTWTVPAGSVIVSGQGTTMIAVLPGATSGNVSVTAYNACGSSSATAIALNINNNPVVSLGQDVTQCGGSVTLDAQIAGATYLWSDASTNQTLTVNQSGTYSVHVTDANGCIDTDTINVTINTIPTPTGTAPSAICIDDAVFTLSGTPAGGTWSGPGMSGNTFDPVAAGSGTHQLIYAYTDMNTNCTGTDTVSVFVDLCLAVGEMANSSFGVFPNPNTGSFVIEFNTASEKTIVEVLDVTGKTVQSTQLNTVVNGSRATINCNGQPNGVYFIRVSSNGETSVQRMVISK